MCYGTVSASAEAFVEELEKRKASVDRPGRFPGVLGTLTRLTFYGIIHRFDI
jgi:hypothetical protein